MMIFLENISALMCKRFIVNLNVTEDWSGEMLWRCGWVLEIGLIIYNVGERWTGRSQAAETKAFIQ